MGTSLDLTKIKIGKDSVKLVYMDFVQNGEDSYTKEVEELCKAPPTVEFKDAVKAMEHFVQDVVPLEQKRVEKLTVTQISITNEDDGLGIVLSVTAKFKKSSRPLNFNTPYWSTLDNENPLPDAAVDAVENIKKQAKAYSGGLYEQASLDLQDKEAPDPNDPEKDPGSEESENTPDESVPPGNLNVGKAFEEMKEQAGNGASGKPRKKRRTKLEMEKARAEEQETADAAA